VTEDVEERIVNRRNQPKAEKSSQSKEKQKRKEGKVERKTGK